MSHSYKKISILLITIALIVTSSLADHHHHHHRDRDRSDREQDLRDLCSNVGQSKQCWEIVKSMYDRFDTDDAGIAATSLDLARGKASDFNNLCRQLHEDSNDDRLKEKYERCAKSYEDATRDLDDARSDIDSNDYQNIPGKVDNANEEVRRCIDEFGNDAFDPAHVGDRNREFGVYTDIAKVAADRLVDRS